VLILCEDALHRAFVTRFLKQYDYAEYDLRVRQCPPRDGGAAEAFVRRSYSSELKAYRSRSTRAKTILIVVIDADTGSVKNREAQLQQACEDANVPVRQRNELVLHVIPKRAINTWLAYLDGQSVDETTDYANGRYAFRKCESAVSSLVKRLHGMCEVEQLRQGAPPSLHHACKEFERIKDRFRL